MSYDKTKAEVSSLRTKQREARRELDTLLQRQNTIDAELNKEYDNYLQSQADNKAGECTENDATKAERVYLKLKDEKSGLEKEIEVAERVASILKGKVLDAEYRLSRDAQKHYREKLEPHFDKIDRAISEINSEIEAINNYRKDMQADKVPESVLKGIDHKSQALISKGKLASIQTRNFITQINQ
jgi:uncharacterized protein YllA (UPF0747 family)